MIKSLAAIAGGLLQVWGGWLSAYANPKNTEARIISEENKKKDEMHEAAKNKDLDTIRRMHNL